MGYYNKGSYPQMQSPLKSSSGPPVPILNGVQDVAPHLFCFYCPLPSSPGADKESSCLAEPSGKNASLTGLGDSGLKEGC